MNILLSFVVTLLIIFTIPIFVYGLSSKLLELKEPEEKGTFFKSVLIQKIGTSIGFVWIFYLAKDTLTANWLTYGMVWFCMYAIVEIGQSIAPNYTKKEAIAGILSELIYFPLAAASVAWILS